MKINKVLLMSVASMGGLVALASLATAAETPATPAPARAPALTGTNRFQMPDRSAMIAKNLGLNADQQTKLKAVLDDEAQQMKDFRLKVKDLTPEQRRAKYTELRDGIDAKIKPILTPEQYQKWEAMRGKRPAGAPGVRPAAQPAK